MRMRSLLFVPANSDRKISKAMSSHADALIFDLEDSVPVENKIFARERLGEFIKECDDQTISKKLFVRINEWDSSFGVEDLDSIIFPVLTGIVIPKCTSLSIVKSVSEHLCAREKDIGLKDHKVQIIALTNEMASDVLASQPFPQGHPRLLGLTWGAEDLRSDLGARTSRDENGRWLAPFQLAQTLCLLNSRSTNSLPIDTVYADFRDLPGLERDCMRSKDLGFVGRLAIHPDQIEIINNCYSPSNDELDLARLIIKEFMNNRGVGAISINGKMYDLPHLKASRQLLASDS